MRMLLFLGVLLICAHGKQAMGKTGRTLLTDEQVRQGRENVAKLDWARKSLADAKKSVEWVLAMPDEELWEFIPPADQPRALNVRFGFDCPIHGAEVFKKGGHYPWIMDREHPFKVKCPIGGETYPSNDFEAYYKSGKKDKLDAHAQYVDDGNGWIDKDGNRYWFVGHYIFWQRWRTDILPVIPQLAYIYTLTGDTRYSHKAAVMLARIASEYPKMDYTKQAYHNGHWPAVCTGKILDLDWEGGATVVPLATAYDEIYDGLDGDAELKAFLAAKNIASPKDHFETNFLQEAARAIEAEIIHGNMNYQEHLAVVATVLDNRDPKKGFTTDQMVDWIMNGPGEMNTLLYNGVSRDGSGSEESLGYNSIWTNAFMTLAEKLKPLGYDLFANPRLKKMTDFFVETTVADKFSPCIGDADGSMTGGSEPVWGSGMFSKAYKIWGDPAHAKVLNRIGWPRHSIYEKPDTLDAAKDKAKALTSDMGLKTRDLGGYGLAVLETGEGENRRAVSMLYGCSGAWHGHLDRLNIEMWSHGRSVLPEMGYPAHWGDKADYWTRGTPSHYCVEIDENAQSRKMEGHLNLLASAQGVQVMDASGENAYRGIASLYRRTVAMVDSTPTDSYLLDVYRVKGGKRHDYIFHGLPFGEFSLSGVTLGPAQTKGTLMGEDVEFGKVFQGMKTGGYQWLSNPRRGQPAKAWSADWFVKDKGLGLRMTMLAGSAAEVIVANGQPEAKPDFPEKMEYILARNDTGASTFVSVIEPYKDKPSIHSVEAIKLNETRDDLVAVRVEGTGRTDYLFNALDGSKPAKFESGNMEFAGEFGAITEDASGLSSMVLVNGSVLRKGKCSIRVKPAPRMRVAKVDYLNNCITLDRKMPMPNALIGLMIAVSNPMHSASLTVTSVETKAGRTVLHLDASMIEGIGTLKSVDEATKTVESSNRLAGYGIKWDGKLIPGRALVNEALTDSWPISFYDNSKWNVKSATPVADKIKLTNGKPSKVFYVGEVCVGDDVMLPAVSSVKRGESGYVFSGTVPFEFTDASGKTHALRAL